MEEECEIGRTATPLLTRAHANAATTRPIVADKRQPSTARAGEAAQAESRTWGSLSRARFLKLDGS